MGKIIFAFFSCLLCSTGQTTNGQVRLPRLVSDGMVLQRDTKVKIWGWAAAGETVSIDFNAKTYHTVAGTDGKWQVLLAPTKAGGPYNMQISATNQIVLKNILAGDVWICSGQSNMELPMDRVKEKYAAVIEQSANPFIRQFNVGMRYSFQSPLDDFLQGQWESANPQTVLNFSAAGYFFAKTLYEKYHIPIGLVKVSVGGSPVEAWLSEEALRFFPAHLVVATQYKNNHYVDSIRKSDNAVSNAWYSRIWQQDKGLQENPKWFEINHHPDGWPTMQVPGYWDDQGLKNTNGVVWFRKDISVPASMTGTPARLLLGNVVDRDSVYINGKFVGTTGYQYPPRKYVIDTGILKEGENTIVVRVINSAGKGGFYRDKPYQLIAGNHVIDIKGEWQYQLGVAANPLPSATTFQYQPLGLFNGMIAPLLHTTIKGVIWYQGESNTARPKEYRPLFTALIKDWRQKWGQGDFPFLYVQLANYLPAKPQPAESNWAELREAQLKTLAVPNTGMAVITDIGEWNDIHPLNKEDVGKRLALAADHIAYGNRKIVFSGPIYQSMKKEGNKIILSFMHTGSGLIAKGDSGLEGFAIAGNDKKFVWAKAIIAGNKIIVWNDIIVSPVAVRYAWADNPEGANLYNKEGLPASSFRTDQVILSNQ